MHEKEYERLKRQIREAYEEELRALEMVWKRASNTSASGTAKRGRKGEVLEVVKRAVEIITDEFTHHHVLATVKQTNPHMLGLNRASVASALRRLAADRVLEIVKRGKGKRPSLYRRC